MAAKVKIKKTSYRGILLYIQNNLTQEERHNWVFLKELPQKDTEDCENNFRNFWVYMLNRPNEFKYGEDDPSELFDDLLDIGRQDICKTAKEKYGKYDFEHED